MTQDDACPICEKRGHVRWTTLRVDAKTIKALGLPPVETGETLDVCHGCYLNGMTAIFDKLGWPKDAPRQLLLPLGAL